MKCVFKKDNILLFVLFSILFVASVKGGTADGCLPLDPNCHPSCMVYDAARCRYCRPGCNNGYMGTSSSGGGSSWSSGGGSGSSDWDAKFSSNDWSAAVTGHQDAFSGSGNSGSSSGMSGFSSGGSELSGGNSYSGNGFSGGSSSGSGGFSGNTGNSHTETVKYVYIEKEPEPSYSGSVYPDSSLLPGSFPGSGSPFLTPSMMDPGLGPSGPSSHSMMSSHGPVAHVPLLAPGVPKYCVRDKILGCPTTCERIDEWGCRSCPCAPARFQTMPVLVGGHQTVYTHKTEATSSREPSCPETLKCMLQCKDGYFLGNKMPNGCPSCRCLNKGAVGSSNGHGQKNGFQLQGGTTNPDSGGSSKWNSGSGMSNWNSGSGTGHSGTGSGSGSGSNNWLDNSNNGVGKGQCKPPLCADPNMSEKDAMEMGKDSAGGGFGGGSGMGGAGMTSGSGSSSCKPPMCLGEGQTMGSLTGNYGGSSGSGSSGSSGGCSGPFCASGNGMGMGSGGGSGMGSGSGGSGMPFSPFSSALSGSGAGSGPGTPGGSGGFGMQSAGSSTGSTGTSSSEHKDCPGLLHCMVTCDGNYILGALDSTGCQSCSCS